MLESQIQAKCVKYAKEQGWLAYKFTSPGNSGVPDYIFIRNATLLMVEFKTPSGRLSALQSVQIDRIMKQGVPVFVINDVNAFKSLIAGYAEEN